jgi:predicted polyphosphate/ATP-dependent NAD kinase
MKLGLVINPLAGIGGSVALKGSDGSAIVDQALARGAEPMAGERSRTALQKLAQHAVSEVKTASSDMGENLLRQLAIPCSVVYHVDNRQRTTAQDTQKAVQALVTAGIDLLVFAGGDGTARDVLDGLNAAQAANLPVLGIPAGCKIHSAVYAVTPSQAGELLALIADGLPMSLHPAEVMDLDEVAFRAGQVKASCYGYLQVPVDDTRMQVIKQGGIDHEAMALQDIASDVVENMETGVIYFIGSGSTTAAIMDELGLDNTLLGVDAVLDHQLLASDIDASTMLQLVAQHPAKIVVTSIGGQGHIFGRGNQQFSPALIRKVLAQSVAGHAGRDNILIVASNEKLRSLEGRPLLIDSGDPALDIELAGMVQVISGYQQRTLYKLGQSDLSHSDQV